MNNSIWNWDAEIEQLPMLLGEKVAAPSVEPGRYDLLIHPSNLWLTIHESIGHATELDRAIGYEANYAGTSFATPDKLGTLKYGSELMNVTGDRSTEHGLSTVGWDDEGVAAQRWEIVKDGVLVGYQLDRRIAAAVNKERSNGCAYSDSPAHVPIQRMPNVSLQANPTGPTLEKLIESVEDGIYILGDKSWSIDMQRYNFQFTGQQFHRIKNGKLVGQLKDVAYQATTTDFWGSMKAVGGPSTYVLGGAFNCGKAQPGQVAAVSHGCPAAVFDKVNVLNTVAEASK
jgi:TldD protein